MASPPFSRHDPATPLRIIYLAPADIQVARVDRQAIVYFCSALAAVGTSVTLVALKIRLSPSERHRPDDPLTLYGVENGFSVHLLSTPLHQESASWLVAATRLLRYLTFALGVTRRDSHSPTLFYVKNYSVALALLAIRRIYRNGVIFESHVPPRTLIHRLVLSRVDGIVANSHALARDLLEDGVSSHVLPTHQGIDLRPYQDPEPDHRQAIRTELQLPPAAKLVVYTGKIYKGYKEIEYLLQAAALIPPDVGFVFVGGREDHVAHWRDIARQRGLSNVRFVGFVPPSEIHRYHLAADALLLYYPGALPGDRYFSPGKLFGYMAAAVPIIAVDLPVLREVLGDPPAATLVPPDAPAELAAAIVRVFAERERSKGLAALALERVEQFTWVARAKRITEFVQSLAVAGSEPAGRPPPHLTHEH